MKIESLTPEQLPECSEDIAAVPSVVKTALHHIRSIID